MYDEKENMKKMNRANNQQRKFENDFEQNLDLLKGYNARYGSVKNDLFHKFEEHIKQTYQCKNWDNYFALLFVKGPPNEMLHNLLLKWLNGGLKKQYVGAQDIPKNIHPISNVNHVSNTHPRMTNLGSAGAAPGRMVRRGDDDDYRSYVNVCVVLRLKDGFLHWTQFTFGAHFFAFILFFYVFGMKFVGFCYPQMS